VPDGDDAGDVVLDSLVEFSIRYHALATTSPNIVGDLQLLVSRIDRATIQSAGLQNRQARNVPLSQLLDSCVRYAVGVDVAIHRRQIWMAVELLHRMRGIVMELFAAARGGKRPLKFFEWADTSLQARLGATLPQFDWLSVEKTLAEFLDLLENDLAQFADCPLGDAHRRVLRQVRSRQAQLDFGKGNDERPE
jgi:hypothetical protein